MKKILFSLLVIFISISYINASCNYEKYQQHSQIAGNITYETQYDENNKTYSITFYNVYDGVYISYNNSSYHADSNNEIIISDIKEGEKASFTISTPLDDCKSYMKNITITFDYYNSYYYDSRCDEYRDKLNICSEKFLQFKPNETLFKSIIENYNSSFKIEKKEKVEEEKTVLDSLKEILFNWGIPVIIVIVISLITSSLFKARLRKIKHGI